MRLSVAFAGVTQSGFDSELASTYFRASEGALQTLLEQLDIDLIVQKQLIVTGREMRQASAEWSVKGIDAIILQTSSFASGELALELATFAKEKNLPIILWGISEPSGGPLLLNSFCCANFYSSIFKQIDVKYRWLFSHHEQLDAVEEELREIIQALKVIKRLKNDRVAVIGSARVPGFYGSNFDELAVKERFGVTVDKIDLSTVFAQAEAIPAAAVRAEIERVYGATEIIGVSPEQLEKSVRPYLALRSLAEEAGYAGYALKCWPEFPEVYGAAVCLSVAMLNEAGIITSDESDLMGLISMLISHYATGFTEVPTLLDMVAFDEKQNTVGVWHCGGTAWQLGRDGGQIETQPHFNQVDENQVHLGSACEMLLRTGPVTLSRLMGSAGAEALIFEGNVIDTPMQFRGSYGDVKLPSRLAAKDLVDHIMDVGCEHHYALIYSHIASLLREICFWLDVKVSLP